VAIIRRAEAEDAEAVAALLIRSIREVCGPDYGNDEAMLSAWCANKTPENIRRGILNPNNYWIVALEGETIAGTALLTTSGKIALCFILPEWLHLGIGKALLNDLINYARVLGIRTLTLESTRTGREFYKRNGFIELGETKFMDIIPSFLMERDLTHDAA
jgi:N-acetylglutamate synthase-like GNAT family acetyltransferase